MKKLIYIPKTNFIQLNKSPNSAFRGYPTTQSWEDITYKDFMNIDFVSLDSNQLKESFEMDNNYVANQKDIDQNNSDDDLDTLSSTLDERQENIGTEDEENINKSPEIDSDLDANEEE